MRERGKFRFQRRNVRHFLKLPGGSRHQPVRHEDAQPGGREEAELAVESGGGEDGLRVHGADHVGQTPLVSPVQGPVVIREIQVTQTVGKYCN